MSVAKVSELTSESNESFEQAVNGGIDRAMKTLRNVRSVWVKDHEIEIGNGNTRRYRVTLKVTFVLND
ncbi:MAG TPA: dodecin family protein [Polyangiales bacterium]|nr:dodecin family protein [Polyangiales bacterium]